ncbi:MAG: hypothetical protein HY719_05620 [Planctomycetes bacterium]|nr:hypothetical protein [Planctomycetota bacterium]
MKVLAVAGITLREHLRPWPLAALAALVLAALFAGYAAVPVAEEAHRPSAFLSFALAAAPFFAFALAVAPACFSLPGEFEFQQVSLVFTRPVRRWQYLAGKLLGHAGHLAALAALYQGCLAVAAALLFPAESPGLLRYCRAARVEARGTLRQMSVRGRAGLYLDPPESAAAPGAPPAESGAPPAAGGPLLVFAFNGLPEAARAAGGPGRAVGEVVLPALHVAGRSLLADLRVAVRVRDPATPGAAPLWENDYRVTAGRAERFNVAVARLPAGGAAPFVVELEPLENHQRLGVARGGVRFASGREGYAWSLALSGGVMLIKMLVVLAAAVLAAAHFSALVNLVVAGFTLTVAMMASFLRMVIATVRADAPGLFTSREEVFQRFGPRPPPSVNSFFDRFTATFRGFFEALGNWFPDWWRADPDSTLTLGLAVEWRQIVEASSVYLPYAAALAAVALLTFPLRGVD